MVFTSRRLTVTVRRYGVGQEFIQPHTPQQNGTIERLFRTIKEQCIRLTRFESLNEAKSVIGRCVSLYHHTNPCTHCLAASRPTNGLFGHCGLYFAVRNKLSAYTLSLLTRGRFTSHE